MKFTEPWGWSKLDTFRQCPKKFYYQYIEKLPTPSSKALERGSRIHDEIDSYIKGWSTVLPKEAVEWSEMIAPMVVNPQVTGEKGIGLSSDWTMLQNWFQPDTWLRVKMDAMWVSDEVTKIIDWKTGKYRKPSTDQLKLYAASAPSIVPGNNDIEVEMIYIDQYPQTYNARYTVSQAKGFRKEFEREAAALYDNEAWPEHPSAACRWCPFSRHNGGPCIY